MTLKSETRRTLGIILFVLFLIFAIPYVIDNVRLMIGLQFSLGAVILAVVGWLWFKRLR